MARNEAKKLALKLQVFLRLARNEGKVLLRKCFGKRSEKGKTLEICVFAQKTVQKREEKL